LPARDVARRCSLGRRGAHREGTTHKSDGAAGLFGDRQGIDVTDVVAEPADGAAIDLADMAFDLPVEFPALAQRRRHEDDLGRRAPIHAAGDHAQ
jgi:hypothetical protein